MRMIRGCFSRVWHRSLGWGRDWRQIKGPREEWNDSKSKVER
jgi:hypothetical protein